MSDTGLFEPVRQHLADTSPSTSGQGVVVTGLGTIDANASISVPTPETAAQQQAFQESDESMEEWMRRMRQIFGNALESELLPCCRMVNEDADAANVEKS